MLQNAIIEEKNELSHYAAAEIIAVPGKEEQGARPSSGSGPQMPKNLVK